MEAKNRFFVIDGIDGAGKTTQIKLLTGIMHSYGITYQLIDFPIYGTKSAGPVELYLNGQLGAKEDVTAQQASVLYAVDRFCAAPKIREWLSAGEAVLSNRYTSANLGHQGAKIKDSMERRIFWEWNLWFEYDFMKIPRPCKTILLMVQPEIAFELIGRKSERGYLAGKKRDIHEDDLNFLKASYDSFHELAAVYPEDFEVITCDDGTNILPESVITGMIWRQIFTYFF